jgi:hypothetical protein
VSDGPKPQEQRTVRLDTKRLTRHYDKLTPQKRASLMASAFLRGDEVEHGRLIRTSPRELFSLPAFHGHSQAFRELADFYVICQLEIGIGIAVGLASLDANKAADPKRIVPLRVLAHRFVVWRDAWQRLCDDCGIDWPAYLSLHPASATMRHLEELAPRLAFSPKFAEAVLHRGDEPVVITVDELYELLKEMMEDRVAAWT